MTVVAALRHDAITAPFVIDRAMTGAIFRDTCAMPRPDPGPGDIVVRTTCRLTRTLPCA